MRKYAATALVGVLIALWAVTVFAAGSCTVTNSETINILSQPQRKFITLTCTGDGTIAAYTFNPVTYGVRGWYLYNITTDPDGTSAPTDLYDITCLATGEDVCGGLLADRSTSARQTVTIAPTTLGYHMLDGSIAFTFANETANPSVFVMTLRFTAN